MLIGDYDLTYDACIKKFEEFLIEYENTVDLEKMTKTQLKDFSESLGINLTMKMRKDEMIASIRSAM